MTSGRGNARDQFKRGKSSLLRNVTLTPMPSRRMTWPQIVSISPWQPLEEKGGEEGCPGTLSVGPRPCFSQLGWSPHWCSFGERLVFSYHAADRDRPRCRHRCGHSPTTVCSLGDCSSYLAGGTSLPSSARPPAKFELSHTRILAAPSLCMEPDVGDWSAPCVMAALARVVHDRQDAAGSKHNDREHNKQRGLHTRPRYCGPPNPFAFRLIVGQMNAR